MELEAVVYIVIEAVHAIYLRKASKTIISKCIEFDLPLSALRHQQYGEITHY